MIKRIFRAIIDLQLWEFKLGGKRAHEYLGSERWVCPLKHVIKVYNSFHSTFDLILLFSLNFHHLIFIGRGLPSSFRGGFAAASSLSRLRRTSEVLLFLRCPRFSGHSRCLSFVFCFINPWTLDAWVRIYSTTTTGFKGGDKVKVSMCLEELCW